MVLQREIMVLWNQIVTPPCSEVNFSPSLLLVLLCMAHCWKVEFVHLWCFAVLPRQSNLAYDEPFLFNLFAPGGIHFLFVLNSPYLSFFVYNSFYAAVTIIYFIRSVALKWSDNLLCCVYAQYSSSRSETEQKNPHFMTADTIRLKDTAICLFVIILPTNGGIWI